MDRRYAMKTIWAALLALTALSTPAQAETVTYLHTDLLGSVVLETDQNRNVVQRYEYEPYGLPRQAIADAPGYTGHVHDAGSGLVYMQQRYYDPEVGRFLSVDPMPADTATGWNFNRYNYAANNPYTFVDPDGRMVGKPWEEPSGSLPDPLSGPDDLRRHAGLVSWSEDGGQSQRDDEQQTHEYQTYQNLTDAEKDFVKRHALVARDFYRASRDATAEAKTRYPGELSGGRGDAFRHAYWSARMAREHGAVLAKEFGDAHEDLPTNSPRDKAMDLYNNAIGRRIGASYKGPRPLADRIDDEIKAGTLRWLP